MPFAVTVFNITIPVQDFCLIYHRSLLSYWTKFYNIVYNRNISKLTDSVWSQCYNMRIGKKLKYLSHVNDENVEQKYSKCNGQKKATYKTTPGSRLS
jgi:hypothetical protein